MSPRVSTSLVHLRKENRYDPVANPRLPIGIYWIGLFSQFSAKLIFFSSLTHFMMEKYFRLCSVESAHNDKGKMGDLDPFMCPLESF